MSIIRRTFRYLNPITHLGVKKYSIVFPLFTTIATCFLSEGFAYGIAKNPNIVGMYIIFVNVAMIIYFAFRDGIRGGIIATIIPIFYYFYIIYTRNYQGQRFISGIETTIILALLYLLLGTIIGWLKQKIDTLLEKEADARKRLETIIQQLPVGVLITDNKGKIVQGNKQIENILGRKIRQGLIVGKDIIPNGQYKNKQVSASQWPLAQTLNTGKPVIGKEFTIDREDGKKVYLQISASSIQNKRGEVIAAASIISDITQQKEMEARKDDFVNMASHELKTPVTSMKLYIDSLISRIRRYNDERAIKTLSSIKTQTEKLQELVNDLLDVSRLQTGKLGFSKEEFRLDSLIEEIIESLQETAKNQKIIYVKRTPTIIYGDKFRIYQVLTNLITNAIKYSYGESNINVSIKRLDGKAVVSVQDYGIGIAKDQQKKIFDRLYQVTDPQEKTFPGLGMGLYISKEIIKRHRGTIWVESEKRKGSTFYFSLPLQKKAA